MPTHFRDGYKCLACDRFPLSVVAIDAEAKRILSRFPSWRQRRVGPQAKAAGRRLVAAAGAALAGCAHSPPVALAVAGDERGCRFEAEGRSLTEATMAMAALGWRERKVRIVAGTEIPYKCFGLAILTLQRAGVERIRFSSEPPPGPR